MITKDQIVHLTQLARIEISDEEIDTLTREIPEILSLVESIQDVEAPKETKGQGLHNVMRPDENPQEAGIYTETLLSAAPVREGNRIAVKQVVSRKSAK